jgi:hypothetical protein
MLIRMPALAVESCGDIITIHQYSDFDLQVEWKTEPGGNSGIKYLVQEERPTSWEQAYRAHYVQELKNEGRADVATLSALRPEKWNYMAMGFELQLIDDGSVPETPQNANRMTGALYDLIAPSDRARQVTGQFTQVRLLVQRDHVEHWINGEKLVEFEMGSKAIRELIQKSKFEHMDGFGETRRGHIALQDHGSRLWFRNIKIRNLSTSP